MVTSRQWYRPAAATDNISIFAAKGVASKFMLLVSNGWYASRLRVSFWRRWTWLGNDSDCSCHSLLRLNERLPESDIAANFLAALPSISFRRARWGPVAHLRNAKTRLLRLAESRFSSIARNLQKMRRVSRLTKYWVYSIDNFHGAGLPKGRAG